jgi:hypothetical protein
LASTTSRRTSTLPFKSNLKSSRFSASSLGGNAVITTRSAFGEGGDERPVVAQITNTSNDRSQSWTVLRCSLVSLVLAALLGGTEVALVFGLKVSADYPFIKIRIDCFPRSFNFRCQQAAVRRDLQWPLMLMAILSAVLLALGVGRHYLDIIQTKTVRGISFFFVSLDAMGDLTSLLSLC